MIYKKSNHPVVDLKTPMVASLSENMERPLENIKIQYALLVFDLWTTTNPSDTRTNHTVI